MPQDKSLSVAQVWPTRFTADPAALRQTFEMRLADTFSSASPNPKLVLHHVPG